MKIVKASIDGFMGIDTADIKFGHVNVFVGANGAGKSSIMEAVLLPVFGTVSMTTKKKDLKHLVRHGRDHAEIFVQAIEQTAAEKIPLDLSTRISAKGGYRLNPLKELDPVNQVLLTPLRFLELPAKVKAELVGDTPLDAVVVKQELLNRGLTRPEVLDRVVGVVIEHRLAGAERVLGELRLSASRTIRDLGQKPVYPGEDVKLAKEETQAAFGAADEAAKALGLAKHALRQALGYATQTQANAARRQELERLIRGADVPDAFPEQDKLDACTKRVEGLEAARDKLQEKLRGLVSNPCPTCGQPWIKGAGGVQQEIGTIQAQVVLESMAALEVERLWAQWSAKAATKRTWVSQLSQLPKEDGSVPSTQEMQVKVDELQGLAATAQAKYMALSTYMADTTAWERAAGANEYAKGMRAAWDTAVNIIRDPEFRASLTSDPLDKARARLAETQKHFGMDIRVDQSLDVTESGRPWWTLSASEKMVLSILLTDAFAHASGTGILRIDGVDTLVESRQVQLAEFLLAIKQDYDTIMLALATESAEPSMASYLRESGKHLGSWFWISREGGTSTITRSWAL